MLRAHTGTKPETPIDGASENWAVAPATGPRCARGWLPFPSYARVAQTATRTSSQGPASALRFNYFWWGGSLPPFGRTTESRPSFPKQRRRTSTRQNNKFISELLLEINIRRGRSSTVPCRLSFTMHPHIRLY